MKKNLTVEIAKDFLMENGYFVDNLWHIDDVKNVCKCTDEQAQEVLLESLANEYTISEINESIRDTAESMGLEMIEEDDEDED